MGAFELAAHVTRPARASRRPRRAAGSVGRLRVRRRAHRARAGPVPRGGARSPGQGALASPRRADGLVEPGSGYAGTDSLGAPSLARTRNNPSATSTTAVCPRCNLPDRIASASVLWTCF